MIQVEHYCGKLLASLQLSTICVGANPNESASERCQQLLIFFRRYLKSADDCYVLVRFDWFNCDSFVCKVVLFLVTSRFKVSAALQFILDVKMVSNPLV
jgi:hypothetical protein